MFVDRKEAGNLLARALKKYQPANPIVLGIVRGGLEIGYHVASYLETDFNLLIIKKLGYPYNPKVGFGTLAEDGSTYVSDLAKESLSEELIQKAIDEAEVELSRRIKLYRDHMPFPDMKDREVVLVDDGIITGATLYPAIELCRKKGAKKIIVATPVAGKHMPALLKRLADEVVILLTPKRHYALSDAYMNFEEFTDEDALAFIKLFKQEKADAEVNVNRDE